MRWGYGVLIPFWAGVMVFFLSYFILILRLFFAVEVSEDVPKSLFLLGGTILILSTLIFLVRKQKVPLFNLDPRFFLGLVLAGFFVTLGTVPKFFEQLGGPQIEFVPGAEVKSGPALDNICSTFTNEYDRLYCTRDPTDLSKISLCDKMSDPELQEECYWETAIIKTDASFCEKIAQSLQNICYWDVSVATFARTGRQHHDFSLCEKIENPEVKNSCYFKSYSMEPPEELKEQKLQDILISEEKRASEEECRQLLEPHIPSVLFMLQREAEKDLPFIQYADPPPRCVNGRCGVPGWEFKTNAPSGMNKRSPFKEVVDVTVVWPDGRKTVLDKDINLGAVTPSPATHLTYRFVKYGTYQGYLPKGTYDFVFTRVDGTQCLVSEQYDGELLHIPENITVERIGNDLRIRWYQELPEMAKIDRYEIRILPKGGWNLKEAVWFEDYLGRVKEENELVIVNPPLVEGEPYRIDFNTKANHAHSGEFYDFIW